LTSPNIFTFKSGCSLKEEVNNKPQQSLNIRVGKGGCCDIKM